ncbi:conserved hypothetical protein [Solidesulfovibrio fructosivorans JJ]]|uniref:Uncharacterized protein n=1 Tax=Solidesulfovibrio fructosivorans JJ] TaxID=596151 RepID=E1K0K7_SOLFR|nr:hypothetical protein [Solidesulfovibrio fructosivorans]EFL49859.1 conserved hypothetical protein [Solidesulfovibrio fructosivorans JJ]]
MAQRRMALSAGMAALVGAIVLATLLCAPSRALAVKRAGAFWSGLSREQKTDLILGIFDGFNLNENILGITLKNEYTICTDIMESIMRQSDAFFAGMPAGRIVTALDAFYTDRKNRNIPVSWGLWVVVRQNRKDPTVGDFLRELRALYP